MDTQGTANPSFYIGNLPVYGDLILAPMDGISSYPFRSITRVLGSAMSYTEFIPAVDAIHLLPRIHQHIDFREDERPVVFQLLDNDVDRLVLAATNLMRFRPDVIDINIGCPSKDIANRGAGAGLMKSPGKIASLFAELSALLPIPVTAKIRLGWDDDHRNYLEVAQAIEENGGALLAVHGRTKKQGYSGEADWKPIAEIKKSSSLPVIANGDVRCVNDILRIKQITGCDGVMIGRAALQNPWIFQRIDRENVPQPLFIHTVWDHLDRNLEFFGREQGLIRFRKHILHYLTGKLIEPELRLEMLTTLDEKRFREIVRTIAQR
jgi:nifR3 family TIM-barrel protein